MMTQQNLSQFVQPEYSSLYILPTIITEPGQYVTRCGETVTVDVAISSAVRRNCTGHYSNGVAECWHRSGRLYQGQTCANDIVSKA